MFNPSIGKLDPKTVSCHFIGYPEKSKGFRFYCPDRHTKFVETRHAVFLENEMIRGSMVPREIDLEEKRVYVPTPMIQEPFFSLPIDAAPNVPEIVTPVPSSVVAAPTIPDITMSTPVATPPIPIMIEGSEPAIQEPPEPTVGHEEEELQPLWKMCQKLRHKMCHRQ